MAKHRQKRDGFRKFDKHSSSEDEETELFIRKKSPPVREIPTVEKLVEDGDTLQSLAIRHHCTIEDLKRLNSIHKDNEIYARRTIKVPHHPITEALSLAGIHQSGSSSPVKPSKAPLQPRLSSTLINLASKDEEVNQIIFNSSIIQKPPQPVDTIEKPQCDPDDEEVQLLPLEEDERPPDPVVARLSCSGVDGDISLKALIICIIVVIFAIPIIYVMYMVEKEVKTHHHNLTHIR